LRDCSWTRTRRAHLRGCLDAGPDGHRTGGHGHVLAITREHFETLYELSAQAIQGVALTARRITRALRAAWQPEGLSVIQSNGAAANQTIPHYHAHLIPRRRAEAFHMHGKGVRDTKALDALAAAIAQHLPRA
jgi:histidine triad (HIT) family protein